MLIDIADGRWCIVYMETSATASDAVPRAGTKTVFDPVRDTLGAAPRSAVRRYGDSTGP